MQLLGLIIALGVTLLVTLKHLRICDVWFTRMQERTAARAALSHRLVTDLRIFTKHTQVLVHQVRNTRILRGFARRSAPNRA